MLIIYIGKNWKEYEGDFLLRTDAVWEKQELEHFFRNYTKVSINIMEFN